VIDHLDNLLRHLFLTQISELSTEAQVRFQPPDDEWRSEVVNLQDPALNVYLTDLRENRRWRSNERVRMDMANGQVVQQPAPARVDCHYLISAWSPAQPNLEPTVDEHALLYRATAVLMNHAPLNPARIYGPSSPVLPTVPGVIRDVDLPTQILPVEGFAKLPEFWGTMGANHRWKPAVYLIVTLPVVLLSQISGPMVTTMITEYRQAGRPETAEIRIQIGGHVLDDSVDPPAPVAGAWVRLETPAGELLQTTTTDELGRFTFMRLQSGAYQLNWRAAGYALPAGPRPITVPSPSGEYDLSLS
jgi:hypothetical protein